MCFVFYSQADLLFPPQVLPTPLHAFLGKSIPVFLLILPSTHPNCHFIPGIWSLGRTGKSCLLLQSQGTLWRSGRGLSCPQSTRCHMSLRFPQRQIPQISLGAPCRTRTHPSCTTTFFFFLISSDDSSLASCATTGQRRS